LWLARLCPPWVAGRTAWLDARPTRSLSFTYGSGAAYDSSPAGVRDSRRARADAWYALVREQRAGIAAACRAAGHVGLDT
jgi:hypothetical protein